MLREYVPLRIATANADDLAANIAQSVKIQADLWTITEHMARDNGSDVVALFVASVNDVIDLHESRVTAGIYARVPETVVLLLVGGAALSLGMVGYSAGLTKRRSPLSAVVLVLALGAVLMIVIDLDRPREGFIQVNQQPLIDLQQQIGPPSS